MSNNTSANQRGRTPKRAVTAGVIAGMLGGMAAGLTFGVPGTVGAAADPGIEVAATADRPTHGDRIREHLQELVDDGTLTEVQAQRVAEHLAAEGAQRAPERGAGANGERLRPERGGPFGGAVAEVLGLQPDDLREKLQSGESLADIAAETDVDIDDLVDALTAEATARIDRLEQEGRIDAETAQQRRSDVDEHVSDIVNKSFERAERQGPPRGQGPAVPGAGD